MTVDAVLAALGLFLRACDEPSSCQSSVRRRAAEQKRREFSPPPNLRDTDRGADRNSEQFAKNAVL